MERNHPLPEVEPGVVAQGVAAAKGGGEAEVRKMRTPMQAKMKQQEQVAARQIPT